MTTKDEDLFKDDTDIFADVPASKPKEKKKKKTTSTGKKSIFKDDVGKLLKQCQIQTFWKGAAKVPKKKGC